MIVHWIFNTFILKKINFLNFKVNKLTSQINKVNKQYLIIKRI